MLLDVLIFLLFPTLLPAPGFGETECDALLCFGDKEDLSRGVPVTLPRRLRFGLRTGEREPWWGVEERKARAWAEAEEPWPPLNDEEDPLCAGDEFAADAE